MTANEQIERVRIYLNEQERHEGQPLYLIILDRLRREGATGATVLRGLAGFGPGSFVRLSGLPSLAERPPAIIEWVDRADRVARILTLIDELLGERLVTIEAIQIHRAVLRRGGVLSAGRNVGDLARPNSHTLTSAATLREALHLFITSRQQVIPIVDARGSGLGIIAERELTRRAGLRLPLRLLRLLTPSELDTIIGPVAERTLAQVMSDELRGISTSIELAQVLVLMQEWGYDELPVLGRAGEVVGLLGQTEVLGAMVQDHPATTTNVRDADPPTPVSLVMQAAGVRITTTATQRQVIESLLATPARTLVVEHEGRIVGLMNDESILAGLTGITRAALLNALLSNNPYKDEGLSSNEPLTNLMIHDLPRLSTQHTIIEAAQRLIETGRERLPVVDAEDRLQGMITRGGLMRALTQERA